MIGALLQEPSFDRSTTRSRDRSTTSGAEIGALLQEPLIGALLQEPSFDRSTTSGAEIGALPQEPRKEHYFRSRDRSTIPGAEL